MKNILLICFIQLFCAFVLRAQEYIPLIEENKYWIYGSYFTPRDGPPYKNLFTIRYFEGDTVINGTKYANLYEAFLKKDSNDKLLTPMEFASKPWLEGFYRKDVKQKKVYQVNPFSAVVCPTDQEILLFDFSLDIRDTLPYCYLNYSWGQEHPLIFTISDTGSINDLLCNGQKSRLYSSKPNQINPWINSFSLIEGWGTGRGVSIRTEYYQSEGYQVFVMWKQCCGTMEACGIISGTTRQTFEGLKLFPNPADDILTIQVPSEKAGQTRQNLRVYDTPGQLVLELPFSDQVDISRLTPGVYTIHLGTTDKLYVGRFVKK